MGPLPSLLDDEESSRPGMPAMPGIPPAAGVSGSVSNPGSPEGKPPMPGMICNLLLISSSVRGSYKHLWHFHCLNLSVAVSHVPATPPFKHCLTSMSPLKLAPGISLPAIDVVVISIVLSAVQPSSKLELMTESHVQPHTPPGRYYRHLVWQRLQLQTGHACAVAMCSEVGIL